VDLLKVDVERAELQVLEGVAARDWPAIRQVVLEVRDRSSCGALALLPAMLRLAPGSGLGAATSPAAALRRLPAAGARY
jgi:hypothetical protein